MGAVLSAKEAAGKSVSAAIPFPIDWPKQKGKIVREEAPSDVKLANKPLPSRWASQLVMTVANRPKGQDRLANREIRPRTL